MHIFVTGGAGFIGNALCLRLLESGHQVTSLDNLSDYYDVGLKRARLERCAGFEGFHNLEVDLAESDAVRDVVERERPEQVIHLAAQAGVRYAKQAPETYVQTNLVGFANLLDACRRFPPAHLVYASSSSVYGASARIPFTLADHANQPVSFYAATKRAGELMAYSYSHLYRIPMTGLRLFTVYGPWGRPDMAYFEFTRRILAGEPVTLYGDTTVQRDFTYMDDIVDGIAAASECPPEETAGAPHRIFNLGNDRPRKLRDLLGLLERYLEREAIVKHAPLPAGDVPATWADISQARDALGYAPKVSLEEGLRYFVAWYQDYYHSRQAVVSRRSL